MLTDLSFNLILLMMSDYMVVLLASNCGYILFNWLNLQSGWIHRIDRAVVTRPFRAPTVLLGFNVLLSFCNLAFLGVAAAKISTTNIVIGLIICAMILPVFFFRHYIQDKGVFPASTLEAEESGAAMKKCGLLPYFAILCGVCTVLGFYHLFS